MISREIEAFIPIIWKKVFLLYVKVMRSFDALTLITPNEIDSRKRNPD
jgi:hypothetical protein